MNLFRCCVTIGFLFVGQSLALAQLPPALPPAEPRRSALGAAASAGAAAGAVDGKVISVGDKTVHVGLPSSVGVVAGADVEFLAVIPGLDEPATAGKGRVSRVEGNIVVVDVVQAGGEIAVDYLARITRSSQPAAVNDAPAMPSPARPAAQVPVGDETGWIPLFDGRTFRGWRGIEAAEIPAGWTIENGVILASGDRTSIATDDVYRDFDFELEWSVGRGGNGGVFYRWSGGTQQESWGELILAPEYQILDNAGHPNGKVAESASGAVYGLYGPTDDLTRPVGQWNHTLITARGPHVEHWLNGRLAAAYDIGGDDWNRRVAAGPRFAGKVEFSRVTQGRFALQGFDGEVRYRKLRVRPASATTPKPKLPNAAAGAPVASATKPTASPQEPTGYLGIFTRKLTMPEARAAGLRDTQGALAAYCLPDAGAARGGLQAGDIIMKFDDVPVADDVALSKRLKELADGQKVILTIIRDGSRYTLPLTASPKPTLVEIVARLEADADAGSAEAAYRAGRLYSLGGEGLAQDRAEAVRWYRKAAEKGHVPSFTMLAWNYENGDGVPQDDDEALVWIRKAADANDIWAQNQLGRYYENGRAVDKDLIQAAEWYRKAAEQDDFAAQRRLAAMYYDGRGVARDYEQAVRWLRPSAERGEAYAQRLLGICYEVGNGVARDEVEALRLLRASAEQGDKTAQLRAANMYRQGRGTSKNGLEAVKWYRKAADQGEVDADYQIGLMYYYGEGMSKDYQKTNEYVRKAAEKGHAYAQYFLGNLYQENVTMARNDSEALRWHLKAAEQGLPEAQLDVGAIYENGWGVAKNPEKAFAYYLKAAEQGNAQGQYSVGSCVREGFGVQKNPRTAMQWLKLAADQGNAWAQYNIGLMYQDGEGVRRDPTAAFRWIEAAANKGISNAQVTLGHILCSNEDFAPDYARGLELFRKAAAQNNSDAIANIGVCYENGWGVSQDRVEAIAHYLKSSEMGNTFAKQCLRNLGVNE